MQAGRTTQGVFTAFDIAQSVAFGVTTSGDSMQLYQQVWPYSFLTATRAVVAGSASAESAFLVVFGTPGMGLSVGM